LLLLFLFFWLSCIHCSWRGFVKEWRENKKFEGVRINRLKLMIIVFEICFLYESKRIQELYHCWRKFALSFCNFGADSNIVSVLGLYYIIRSKVTQSYGVLCTIAFIIEGCCQLVKAASLGVYRSPFWCLSLFSDWHVNRSEWLG
jgi:hypothetical protein